MVGRGVEVAGVAVLVACGTAEVTAGAKAADVAGVARGARTLCVDVLPYATQG